MLKPPKIFYLLQTAHSALFRAADQALKKHSGISATQQAVLFLLLQQDRQQISHLADQLRMGKSSLTGLIDRMAGLDLVVRLPNADDGRSFDICLTDKGRHQAQQILPMIQAINQQLLSKFSEEDQSVITRFLTYVSDHAADRIEDAQRNLNTIPKQESAK